MSDAKTSSLPTKRFRVRFRILIDPRRKSSSARRVMTNYRGKFSSFMTGASSVKFTKDDYRDLPSLHECLSHDTKLDDIVEAVVDSKKASDLMSIAPIFDLAPLELKSFILMSCGVRSSSVKKCLKNISNRPDVG